MNPLFIRLLTRRKPKQPLVLFPSIVNSNLSIFSSSFLKNYDNNPVDTGIGSADVFSKPAPEGVHSSTITPPGYTLGRHLAHRLSEVGVFDVFSVPGDLNRALLDHFTANTELNVVDCCNELNAGYAADGYARRQGVGACVVNFTVGGLSVINAIAGAYNEDLPIICITGGLNSNDYGTGNIGLPDISQEFRCFQNVVVSHHESAKELIDKAILTALEKRKPVYITISCDLPAIPYPSSTPCPFPAYPFPKSTSNPTALERAVEYAAAFLNRAVDPVLVGGPKLCMAGARDAFANLADASGYPTTMLPSAKGLVSEHTSKFIGAYGGAASTALCLEIVESADAYLFAGPGLVC